MFIPKKYGQSKTDNCPFCQKQATIMNSQDVPVCILHKEDTLEDLKCVCGETLELKHGKFGIFFSCMNCGNMNLKKVMEFNTIKPKTREKPEYKKTDYFRKTQTQNKTMTTVRSDDPRFFD